MQAQWFLKDEGVSRYFEDFRERCAPRIGEGIGAENERLLSNSTSGSVAVEWLCGSVVEHEEDIEGLARTERVLHAW